MIKQLFRRNWLVLVIFVLIITWLLTPLIIHSFTYPVNKGVYFIYLKKISIKYYAETGFKTGLSEILGGYCIERAKYIVTRTGVQGFIVEKYRISIVNRSISKIICMYLDIIDNGSRKTWFRNKTGSIVIMFDWIYKYHGPVFTEKNYKDYSLPWIKNIYLYLTMNYPKTWINISSTIVPSKDIDRLKTVFYNMLSIKYDEKDHFIEKLYFTSTIMLQETPYTMITVEIMRITTYNPLEEKILEIEPQTIILILIIISILTIIIHQIIQRTKNI